MIASLGTASAYKAGFEHTVYATVNPVTIDGRWTTTTEWSDTQQTMFGPTPSMALFRDKYTFVSFDPFLINTHNLVEILDDTTTDSGDYVVICIDSLMDGGTAPKTDDYKIVLSPTNASWYKGTGSTWASMANPSSFKWATSVNTSFSSGPAHRIYEFEYEKSGLNIGGSVGQIWQRVGVYDSSNAAAGERSWPPGSVNAPDDWGYIPWSGDPVPEGFTFGIIVLLSSIAVVAGAVLHRKRTLPKLVAM
jgi:hypothetical protein